MHKPAVQPSLWLFSKEPTPPSWRHPMIGSCDCVGRVGPGALLTAAPIRVQRAPIKFTSLPMSFPSFKHPQNSRPWICRLPNPTWWIVAMVETYFKPAMMWTGIGRPVTTRPRPPSQGRGRHTFKMVLEVGAPNTVLLSIIYSRKAQLIVINDSIIL